MLAWQPDIVIYRSDLYRTLTVYPFITHRLGHTVFGRASWDGSASDSQCSDDQSARDVAQQSIKDLPPSNTTPVQPQI
jgi:hypothetical protein